jgi:hypothetical protein
LLLLPETNYNSLCSASFNESTLTGQSKSLFQGWLINIADFGEATSIRLIGASSISTSNGYFALGVPSKMNIRSPQ